MALPQCICAPCSISYRHLPGLGLNSPRYPCRVNLRSSRGRVIRCSSGDSGQAPGQADAGNKATTQPSPSWEHSEQEDQKYAGWEPLDRDYEIDKRKGILFTGVGLALAIALSLAGYRVYSKKGTLYSIQHSVVSQYLQLKDTLLGSKRGGSRDEPLTREISSKPSSDEIDKDTQLESSRPDQAGILDTHQKKSPSSQDSFPTEDSSRFSDDDDEYSSGSISDSDLESTEEYNPSDSKKRGSGDSPAQKEKQLDKDGPSPSPTPTPTPTENADDGLNPNKSMAPPPRKSESSVPESSANKTANIESSKQSSSDPQVYKSGSKFPSDTPLESPDGSEPATPERSISVNEAKTSKDSGETVFSVSATLAVPKGATSDVLDLLGLEADSLEGLNEVKPEPSLVKKSPIAFEKRSSPLASEFRPSESVESFGIPAPSSPSAAARARSDGIVVPASVDREQEQAVAALQALKVIEPDVEARDICTRREYARWLIAVTSALARCRAQRVFPAMYIETLSELAFNDVLPEDPDFPYIQGLAEAGLISSNLSRHDSGRSGRSTDGAVFLPESPLSRQDLVCWKIALDGHKLQTADKQKLKAQTGFIDFERINDNALPFLAADLKAGERSVISSTFGYTRRFQPGKPVTKGQAAMALVTGEAADVVAGELTRLEADDMAEAAVAAELSLQARAQRHMDEYFSTELKLEKDSRVKAEKNLEEIKSELERVMLEREDQRLSIEGVHAALQAERDLLHRFRQDMEEQLRILTTIKTEVGIERDRLESIRKEAEAGSQAVADSKAQVEVEKQALILASEVEREPTAELVTEKMEIWTTNHFRDVWLWAEDEAKKARAHAKLLEEVRNRWEVKGIQVKVSKDLDDDNIPALSWQQSGPNTELNRFLHGPPVQDILAKAGRLKSRIVRRLGELLQEVRRIIFWIWQKVLYFVQVLRVKGTESFHVAAKRTETVRQTSFEHASRKAQAVQDTTRSAIAGASAKVSETTAGVSAKVSEASAGVSAKVSEASAGVSAKVSETTSKVTETTRKVADGFQGEARKIAGKFKN